MEIKKVIKHFRGYCDGSSRTFLTDEWRMRTLYMAGYGMWDVRDWSLESNFVPAFEQCLALISSTQWTRKVNKSDHAAAASLIDNISASPIGNKRKILPTYAVLECFAAWSDLRDQISSKKRASVDEWFELNLPEIRQSYLSQLGQAVVELRRECESEHLKEPRSLIEGIERNILVQPWAFDANDGAKFLALLDEVTSIVNEVGRLYRDRIDARIASVKGAMTDTTLLSQLADDELLSDDSAYFVMYTLGLKAEWENLQVWESQLRRVQSLKSTTRAGSIEVSSISTANLLFNCRSLADFLARCSRVSSDYSFATASDKLYNLIGTTKNTVLRKKWDLVVEHFQRHEVSDPLIVNMMAHFCYGIIVSGVHKADTECALDIILSLLSDVSSVLTYYEDCDTTFAKSFLERQLSEGRDVYSLGVGEVFHYYVPPSRSGSTEQSTFVIPADVIGGGGNTERQTNLTSLSAVSALFEDAANATEQLLGNESTRKHFATFGFVTSRERAGGELPNFETRDQADRSSTLDHELGDVSISKGLYPHRSRINEEPHDTSFDGDFYEVRDRLEGSKQWQDVCDVVSRICEEKFGGDLKATLGSTFRDAVGKIQCHDFIRSMVARGMLFKVAKRVINEHRIGKWQIAEDLAFFRDVPVEDLRSWNEKRTKETPELARGKRNFEAFLRTNCHFDSVEKSDLMAHGRFSAKERDLYSRL